MDEETRHKNTTKKKRLDDHVIDVDEMARHVARFPSTMLVMLVGCDSRLGIRRVMKVAIENTESTYGE